MGIMISCKCIIEIHACGWQATVIVQNLDMNQQLMCKGCELNGEVHLAKEVVDERQGYAWVGTT